MNPTTLLDLAARVEAATERSRELDLDIALALDMVPPNKGKDEQAPIGWIRADCAFGVWSAPLFTASLDAAMTLVPEGWRFSVRSFGWAEVYERELFNGTKLKGHEAEAATPALALTAAALRALAASVDRSPKGGDREAGAIGDESAVPNASEGDAPR